MASEECEPNCDAAMDLCLVEPCKGKTDEPANNPNQNGINGLDTAGPVVLSSVNTCDARMSTISGVVSWTESETEAFGLLEKLKILTRELARSDESQGAQISTANPRCSVATESAIASIRHLACSAMFKNLVEGKLPTVIENSNIIDSVNRMFDQLDQRVTPTLDSTELEKSLPLLEADSRPQEQIPLYNKNSAAVKKEAKEHHKKRKMNHINVEAIYPDEVKRKRRSTKIMQQFSENRVPELDGLEENLPASISTADNSLISEDLSQPEQPLPVPSTMSSSVSQASTPEKVMDVDVEPDVSFSELDGAKKTKKKGRGSSLYQLGEYPMKALSKEAFVIESHSMAICILCCNNKYQLDIPSTLLNCHGVCRRSFHPECLNIEIEGVNPETFKCQECETGNRKCFSCGEFATDLVVCPVPACGRFYHYACLMGSDVDKPESSTNSEPDAIKPELDSTKSESDLDIIKSESDCIEPELDAIKLESEQDNDATKNELEVVKPEVEVPELEAVKLEVETVKPAKCKPCPQHECHTCKLQGRVCKRKSMEKTLIRCNKCPLAMHFNFMCFPAENYACVDNPTYMTCWKHHESAANGHGSDSKDKKKKRGKAKRTKGKPNQEMRLSKCLVCQGELKLEEHLVCESCPFAAHKSCLELETSNEGPYQCFSCSKGVKPKLLDIVWFRYGTHRTWPCQIVPESIVPTPVIKRHPGLGHFVVRFLGTREYAFPNSKEILPHDMSETEWWTKKPMDERFSAGVTEAKKLYQELLSVKTAFIDANFQGIPPRYNKIKVNKAIPPAKFGPALKLKLSLDDICNCSLGDPDPCGPRSKCLNRSVQIECQSNCPASDKCQNQKIKKKEYPKLKIFYTADRGWALKTMADVPKGDLVVEYVGEIITVDERKRRVREKLATGDVNFYFLDLTNNRVIDAGPSGNLARFANHSCDANCSSQKWESDGDTHIALIAIRDIKKGEEITFDYRWEYEDGVTSRTCLCGAEKCLGKIGGKNNATKSRSTDVSKNSVPKKQKNPKKRSRPTSE